MDVLTRSVITQFEQYVKLNKKVPPEILTSLAGIEQAGRLADTVAAHMSLKLSEKQKVLEIPDVRKRLEHMLAVIEGEMDVLQIEKRIRGRVKQQMEKSQREYYLNEQMKAIQKELGELDEAPNEIGELEKRIKAAGMPKEAREKANSELAKLKLMSPMSAEATVVRNLHRLAGEVAVEEAQQGAPRHRGGGESARGRPLRPGEGQGAHRRVPRRAAAREESARPDPVPGGTAGRRQDLARAERRALDQPQVRAHVVGRRARRGRDSRPSAHLHRLDAGQDHSESRQVRRAESPVPARRGRQDVDGLPRRSVLGAARSARSRAEQHLQRSLPRGGFRSLRGDVRVHGEQPEHPGAAPRPHGGHPHPRIHRGREEQHRAPLPAAEAGQAERPQARRAGGGGCRHPGHDPLLHARSRRAQSRARDLQDRPQGGQAAAAASPSREDGERSPRRIWTRISACAASATARPRRATESAR